MQASINVPDVMEQFKAQVAQMQEELGDQEVAIKRVIARGVSGGRTAREAASLAAPTWARPSAVHTG